MITFGQAINQAIASEMRRDPKVVLLGEDVAHYGGMFRVTEGLLSEFGEKRVIDTPISEAGFLSMALGAAMSGLRPIVELMFIDFSLVAMDPLLNQIAKTRYMSGGRASAPMVIRTQGGGYKGAASQHSQMLEALFLHVPGIKVVTPSSPQEAHDLLIASIRDPDPVLFIEHKQLYPVKGEVIPTETKLGQAKVTRQGRDLTVVSYSYCHQLALEAAEQLGSKGVACEVIDVRTLNPLDFATIQDSVAKTHRVLIAHEGHARCGFGADLAAQIQERCFDDLDAPVLRLCADDTPIPFAENLESATLPSAERIAARAMELL